MTSLNKLNLNKCSGLQSTSSFADSQNIFLTLWQNASKQEVVIERHNRCAWMEKRIEIGWEEETIISGDEIVEF